MYDGEAQVRRKWKREAAGQAEFVAVIPYCTSSLMTVAWVMERGLRMHTAKIGG